MGVKTTYQRSFRFFEPAAADPEARGGGLLGGFRQEALKFFNH